LEGGGGAGAPFLRAGSSPPSRPQLAWCIQRRQDDPPAADAPPPSKILPFSRYRSQRGKKVKEYFPEPSRICETRAHRDWFPNCSRIGSFKRKPERSQECEIWLNSCGTMRKGRTSRNTP